MKKSLRSKRGQNTAEYILLLALVCGGAIGVFSVFGGTIQGMLVNVTSAFTGVKPEEGTNRQSVESLGAEAKNRMKTLQQLHEVDSSDPFTATTSGTSSGTPAAGTN